ncbi:head-tail connector protein [Zhenhengia sp.]|uniref:head-tail connector protein n=1 Tax=Zhenhengia sp. TaxID=2944208 RepID=UPI003079612C
MEKSDETVAIKAALKLYIKVEDDEDDAVIMMQIKAASSYLKNAGIKIEEVKKNPDDYELYKLAVCMLVGHWYENRGAILIGSISKEIEHSLTSIIVQLK